MKIKLLCSRVGPDFVHNRGDEIPVEYDEGLRMIDAGQAELIGYSQEELDALDAARVAAEVEAAKNKTESETATKKVSTEKAVKK